MRQVGDFLRVLHNPNPNPLTICTVSFEEVECLNLIHDVVSPHTVAIQEWRDVAPDLLCRTTLS
jgi:hypothetical protein